MVEDPIPVAALSDGTGDEVVDKVVDVPLNVGHTSEALEGALITIVFHNRSVAILVVVDNSPIRLECVPDREVEIFVIQIEEIVLFSVDLDGEREGVWRIELRVLRRCLDNIVVMSDKLLRKSKHEILIEDLVVVGIEFRVSVRADVLDDCFNGILIVGVCLAALDALESDVVFAVCSAADVGPVDLDE